MECSPGNEGGKKKRGLPAAHYLACFGLRREAAAASLLVVSSGI